MEQPRRKSLRPADETPVHVVKAVPDAPAEEATRRPPVTIRKISRSVDALAVRVKALERSMGEMSATFERHLAELHRTMGVISRRISQVAAQRPPSSDAGAQADPPADPGSPPPEQPSPQRVEQLRKRVWDEPDRA